MSPVLSSITFQKECGCLIHLLVTILLPSRIFFNSEGLQLLDIKPPRIKIDASCFLNKRIIPFENSEIVQRGIKQKQKVFIHYDNSTVHMTESVKQHLDSSKLSKMDHPAYSPDLAPSDFGLFGTMRNSFTGCELKLKRS